MFSEMNPTTRRAWLRWAWSHDWGRVASFDQAGRLVIPTDDVGPLFFTKPGPLKEWAGY